MSDATGSGVEAVIFDWDGTLMDSKEAILATYRATTTELLGKPFPTEPDDVHRIIQLRAKESFDQIAGGDPVLTEKIATIFQREYGVMQERTQPFPGIAETLASLRDAGIKLGVATSKARTRTELEGKRTGLLDYFDVIVTGDDVERAKPDPESVARAIAELGVAAAAAVYVGDGPNDVIAGRGAGAITVGVSFGFHPDELAAEAPDHVIDHPSELLGLAGIP
jgi:phosphoglycolate phosphatase/pyrophosphatase PpaX